jgi:lysophospholipase L1-like esterase
MGRIGRRIRQAVWIALITGLVYFVISWGLHFYWYYQWEKYYVRGPLSFKTVLNLAWEATDLAKLSNFAPLSQFERYQYHHWIKRWNQLRGPSDLGLGEEMGWPLQKIYVRILPATYLAAFRALGIKGKIYRPDLARIEGQDHAFALLPGVRAKFFEALLIVNTDGYRGPPLDRPKKRIRVLCVGGSTTWGATTARGDKPWPEVLQDLIGPKRFEVINAGVPGHTVIFNEFLFDKHLALKPDLIILYHGFNDFYFIVRDYARLGRRVTAVEHYYRKYLGRARAAGVPMVLVSFPLAFDQNSPDKIKQLYGPWLGKWFWMTLGERLAQRCRAYTEACLARGGDRRQCACSLDLGTGLGWPLRQAYRTALTEKSPITLREFEGVIRTHNLITRRLAREFGAGHVDAARVMFGRGRWFIDFCHYTQEGRRVLARLIYQGIKPLLRRLSERSGTSRP